MLRNLKKWARGWLTGGPHFIIGSTADPYLYRWYVIPRNDFVNVYVHKFLRDDEDRALHDHPWAFLSWMLRGSYFELTPKALLQRRFLSLAFRPPEHRHRVILHKRLDGSPIPCWTFIITGPRVREWGFWCPKGFVHWREFTAPHNSGEIGRGCE